MNVPTNAAEALHLSNRTNLAGAIRHASGSRFAGSEPSRLVNALKLTGVEAISYLSQCQERGARPTVEAMLRRLPIGGMDT